MLGDGDLSVWLDVLPLSREEKNVIRKTILSCLLSSKFSFPFL